MYTWENPRPPYPNELYHHGILGMHWGIRRYQPYRKGDKVKGGKEVGEARRKATREEKRAYKDAKKNLYKSAYILSNDKRYEREVGKISEAANKKSGKNDRSAENAKFRSAQYKDAKSTSDFWTKQYGKDLAAYNKAAKKVGKESRYDASDEGIESAARKQRLKYALSGLVGGTFGRMAVDSGVNKYRKDLETSSNFDRSAYRNSYQKKKKKK